MRDKVGEFSKKLGGIHIKEVSFSNHWTQERKITRKEKPILHHLSGER